MPGVLSRNPERASIGRAPLPIGRRSLPERRNRFNQLSTSTRTDIYARPDVYDMEYEGASNHDARFFARLVARARPRRVLELACGSGRVTFTLAKALPVAFAFGIDESKLAAPQAPFSLQKQVLHGPLFPPEQVKQALKK
jgi:tRNA1(Val) A37 N6-methylase TrmN6